ncbi:MAG: DUF4974 domain-containing protein [Bacteroidales bacterium]|nr:DUF4974 domain-containing protein [Bacteroidales bacterium]
MKLIIKYLNGDLSPDESRELTKWIKRSEENKKTFISQKELWYASNISETKLNKTNIAWEDFEKSIHWEEEERGFKLQEKDSRYYVLQVIKVAAVILLLFGFGLSVLFLQKNRTGNRNNALSEVVTPSGAKEIIELSDGTKVWLNSESRLSYPERFPGDERKVFLSGEAFFNVTVNKRRPFKIETSDLLIQVLGTSFNISSYADDMYIATTLVSGELQISDLKSENDISRFLKPDQRIAFSKESREMKLSYVDVNLYTSWTSNKIVLNNLEFSEVVKRLERWFNVTIEYNDSLFSETRITAKFLNNESLVDVLDVLKTPGKFNYSVHEKTISISK